MTYIHDIAANFWLAFCLYWLPLALCLYGYSVRTFRDYRKDVADRDDAEHGRYYVPTLTIGLILGRLLMALVPVANLLAAIFNVAPEVFGDFFRWLGRTFDMPLVPKRKRTTP